MCDSHQRKDQNQYIVSDSLENIDEKAILFPLFIVCSLFDEILCKEKSRLKFYFLGRLKKEGGQGFL